MLREPVEEEAAAALQELAAAERALAELKARLSGIPDGRTPEGALLRRELGLAEDAVVRAAAKVSGLRR